MIFTKKFKFQMSVKLQAVQLTTQTSPRTDCGGSSTRPSWPNSACDWMTEWLYLENCAMIGRHKTDSACYWSTAVSHMFPSCAPATSIILLSRSPGRNGLDRKQICNVLPVPWGPGAPRDKYQISQYTAVPIYNYPTSIHFIIIVHCCCIIFKLELYS